MSTPIELSIFVGLQAAGKSTYFRTYFAATHVLVSKDLLRNNKQPSRRQHQLIEEALLKIVLSLSGWAVSTVLKSLGITLSRK